MKHENNGKCQKCLGIFGTYPGFHQGLLDWFTNFQATHPEAHISCAGRGKIEQERDFFKGASKAHYGQSAHNYNCAIDVFAMLPGENTIYPLAWFHNILSPQIPDWLDWGWHWTRFPEMPHLEVAGWEELRDNGHVHLVE